MQKRIFNLNLIFLFSFLFYTNLNSPSYSQFLAPETTFSEPVIAPIPQAPVIPIAPYEPIQPSAPTIPYYGAGPAPMPPYAPSYFPPYGAFPQAPQVQQPTIPQAQEPVIPEEAPQEQLAAPFEPVIPAEPTQDQPPQGAAPPEQAQGPQEPQQPVSILSQGCNSQTCANCSNERITKRIGSHLVVCCLSNNSQNSKPGCENFRL